MATIKRMELDDQHEDAADEAFTNPATKKRGGPPVYLTDELIEMVVEMLTLHYRKHVIKKAVAQFAFTRLGLPPPSARTVESAIREARAILRVAAGIKTQDSKAEALAFYQAVARDKSVPSSDRLKAQQRIDALLGHDFKYSDSRQSPEEVAWSIREFLGQAQASVPPPKRTNPPAEEDEADDRES